MPIWVADVLPRCCPAAGIRLLGSAIPFARNPTSWQAFLARAARWWQMLGHEQNSGRRTEEARAALRPHRIT
jgi:hypothetical protein